MQIAQKIIAAVFIAQLCMFLAIGGRNGSIQTRLGSIMRLTYVSRFFKSNSHS